MKYLLIVLFVVGSIVGCLTYQEKDKVLPSSPHEQSLYRENTNREIVQNMVNESYKMLPKMEATDPKRAKILRASVREMEKQLKLPYGQEREDLERLLAQTEDEYWRLKRASPQNAEVVKQAVVKLREKLYGPSLSPLIRR